MNRERNATQKCIEKSLPNDINYSKKSFGKRFGALLQSGHSIHFVSFMSNYTFGKVVLFVYPFSS